MRYDGCILKITRDANMLYILYTAVILMLVGCDQLLKSWTVHHL